MQEFSVNFDCTTENSVYDMLVRVKFLKEKQILVGK